MAKYSIKDLEKVSGIKAHTIRIWEKRYNLIEPSRSDTNIRSYSDADLKKLLNVSLLNRQGWKISHIAKFTEEEIKEKLLHISQDPGDMDSRVEALVIATIDFDEESFNRILNESILANGFEVSFNSLIRKVLQKVGVLWMTGTIDPGQEHFFSNLIRQKLATAINTVKPEKNSDTKRFLLFLPEGEMHELGLLFIAYILKKRGHKTLYLGQNTPFESIRKSSEIWAPDILLLSLVTSINIKPEKYIARLSNSFPQQEILVTGHSIIDCKQEAFPQLTFLKEEQDLYSYLEKL